MKKDIEQFDKAYAKSRPKNRAQNKASSEKYKKDYAAWMKGKENAFKQQFKDIPYEPSARPRFFSEHTRKTQLDYIEKFKDELKKKLTEVFDGFDWATVPIGGPELWSKETVSDIRKAENALKDSLKMAAVQNLEGKKTAPETWTYEASGHLSLRLK